MKCKEDYFAYPFLQFHWAFLDELCLKLKSFWRLNYHMEISKNYFRVITINKDTK